MTDRPANDDPKTGEGTPRWVKVFGIVSVVLVLTVAILLLTGGGNHGPSRHQPPAAAQTQP